MLQRFPNVPAHAIAHAKILKLILQTELYGFKINSLGWKIQKIPEFKLGMIHRA